LENAKEHCPGFVASTGFGGALAKELVERIDDVQGAIDPRR
jgi:hypothetical protein